MTILLPDMTETLTDRERQVLRMLAEGYRETEICRETDLSYGYIRYVTQVVMEKLHARTRTHAVAVAVRRGII